MLSGLGKPELHVESIRGFPWLGAAKTARIRGPFLFICVHSRSFAVLLLSCGCGYAALGASVVFGVPASRDDPSSVFQPSSLGVAKGVPQDCSPVSSR